MTALPTATSIARAITTRHRFIRIDPVLSVAGIPAGASAGSARTFAVTAVVPGGATDTNSTGAVHFTSTRRMATLPADYTFTAAAGRRTFSVTFRTAGRRSITVTDTASSNIEGVATSTVSAAATASFVGADAATQGTPVQAEPASNGARAPQSDVTARLPFGRTWPRYKSNQLTVS